MLPTGEEVLCGVPQRELNCLDVPFALNVYPEININCETHSSTAKSFHTLRNVLIPTDESIIKRVTRTFFESGFHEALTVARESSSTPFMSYLTRSAEKTIELIDEAKLLLFPQSKQTQFESNIAHYSETRDWVRSYIRYIVWHPNCFKIAVAGSDDIIRIYTDEPAIVPVLKNCSQKWITSMAWRPYSASELAVSCQAGVCIWTMDNTMHITRNSAQVIFLEHSKKMNATITSIQWNKNGTLLAAASIGDTDVLIWNVDSQQSTLLKRLGPTCSLLKWSPNGLCLFSSTVGNVFRVWFFEKNWMSERWTINVGHVQSACWSPCSSFLLFVTSGDPILYRIQFSQEQLFTTSSMQTQALPVADLSKFIIDQREIGGQPQTIVWDPNGLYLAITFKDTSCIAIFSTCVKKFNLIISPFSFITGIGVEHPSHITFQSKNRKNVDSVLTIGWSSGRVQYFPLTNM